MNHEIPPGKQLNLAANRTNGDPNVDNPLEKQPAGKIRVKASLFYINILKLIIKLDRGRFKTQLADVWRFWAVQPGQTIAKAQNLTELVHNGRLSF